MGRGCLAQVNLTLRQKDRQYVIKLMECMRRCFFRLQTPPGCTCCRASVALPGQALGL